ncbi:MAG: 4-hydroxy-3-methylbut-2-enyl diphosphate reductase, partial [Spirochaetes bacterium]|nr:4-hydroxy-3-methylbut-2-enyl diphosphate reductase [Spirochaetota bacterium]
NRFALNSLSEKGIFLRNNLRNIINDQNINSVIIRAHGIPPDEENLLKKSNKNIFDFTCPKVKQVQLLANKLSNTEHTIILFGKSSHPEVIGILGYCKKPYYVIKNIEQAYKLPLNKIKKPALISQTTMNSIIFSDICDFLKTKLKNIEIHNTLCNAPIRIQQAAIELSKKMDAIIVVGDKMSANTTTLYEKIKKNTTCWFIETVDDLNLKELNKYKAIGITGGSSTPQWQIESIKKYIEENRN